MPPTRRNPKSEIRNPKEARNPKFEFVFERLGIKEPRFGRRISDFFRISVCAVASFSSIAAFATQPHLASVLPTGGQRGTEVHLNLRGDRLQDAAEIMWYEPGIEVRKLDSVTNNLVKATVRISPGAALGEYHLRVRTLGGLSELRTFFVGPFPVIGEKEPNNAPEQAQKVPLNTTVTGVINKEDVDCFAVDLKKGERLSAEVEGMRLGRGLFDPRLAVLDSDGAVLADVDDTWLAVQDPFVSLTAPHDGRFVLKLREATYGGSGDCQYRLHIGNFPRPVAVFPLGGKAGDTAAFTFFSEATGVFSQDEKLPSTPRDKLGLFAQLDRLSAPTPNWIRVSDFPNVMSIGPAPDREHATVVEYSPPFALNGIIASKGEEDWYRFPASKNVPLEVNVYARQLRSPLDSVIEVFDAAGHSIASNDDAGGPDSALKFTPHESTNYFVRIRDTFGRFGRDYTYRIEVTPASPRVTVRIPEVARNDTQSRQFIVVPRGNRFATLISARRENFNGELHFDFPGLPRGLRMDAPPLPAGADAEPLVFEADPDAPLCGRLLDLTAEGTNSSGAVRGHFRQNVELVQGPNNTAYYDTSVDGICVAVTKEAPYQLRIVEPKVPLVQGGSMALEVVTDRKPGFDEPITVQMVWNPPGVSSQAEATIAKGATNVFYQLNAADNAECRAWKIAALAHAKVDGGEVYVSSQLAALETTSPFLAGKIETIVAHPGQPATLTVKLQQLKPFEGKAKIRLMGLPDKITAPASEITRDDAKAVFDLAVDPKCPPGQVRNLFCSVEVVENGQVISHRIASGGILRVKNAPVKVASTVPEAAKQ